MYEDEDLLPLSALAQWYYCRRRAGLALLEEQWKDNAYTAEGSVLHQHVHSGSDEARGDVRICRGVRLRSLRLGLSGTADCVELHRTSTPGANTITLDGDEDLWIPVPIEYKHGRTRDELEYSVQLCAQAICLEEMLDIYLQQGYLYYEGSRRRKEVMFSAQLRALVEQGAADLHELTRSEETPKTKRNSRCTKCSFRELCGPDMSEKKAGRYLAGILAETGGGDH